MMSLIRSKSDRKNVEEEGKNKRRPEKALLTAAQKQFLWRFLKVKKAKPSILANDRRSLYLCFGEYGEGGEVCYTISSLKLSQLHAAAPDSMMKLEMVKKFSAEGLPRYMGCGLWYSKIVLGGGARPDHSMVREIYAFETSNGTMVELPSMLKGCIVPMLVEVDTKLYAIGISKCPPFQVFDGNHWSELPTVAHILFLCYPFTHEHPDCRNEMFFAVAESRYIFLSKGWNSYYFDTAEQHHGWRKLGTISAPFYFGGTSLIVNDGKRFVHFTFQPSKGLDISVHLIPYDFKIVTQDYCSVELPPYLLKYKDDHDGDIPLANYKLVHLGDNTVCLVLSELRTDGKKKIRCVQCVAFTFKVLDNDLLIKVKFLPRIPMLMYDDDDMDVPLSVGQMIGAFIM